MRDSTKSFGKHQETIEQTVKPVVIMDGLIFIIFMIGLVANAVGLSAPIDGYEVVNVTWTIQPDIPGATPLNLTGTVQEVWAQINTIWPGYQLPRKGLSSRQGPMSPYPPTEPPHNLTDGYLKCGYWPGAWRSAIKEGIGYLDRVPGQPGMPPGPRSCGRVSCSEGAAILWCNDNDHSFSISSFHDIGDAASDIDLNCQYPVGELIPPELSIWASGQIFFPDKWNVIVMEDDC